MGKVKVIPVSFKNTNDDDVFLYELIKSKADKSAYVKELLWLGLNKSTERDVDTSNIKPKVEVPHRQPNVKPPVQNVIVNGADDLDGFLE